MSERSDRWLKRLWFVNGVIVLPLLLWAGVMLAIAAGDLWDGGDPGITAGSPEQPDTVNVEARAVRLGPPQSVRGTDAMLVFVQHGRGSYPAGSYFASDSYGIASGYRSDGPTVNVIFLLPGGESRLLFDQPALILSTDYPGTTREEDVGQSWIAYQVVLDDTNDNGRLDREDRHDLYLTDLDGSGRRRALSDSLSVRSHTRIPGSDHLVVYALEPLGEQDEEDQPQRAFIVDPGTGGTQWHDGLNTAAERAGRIVGR